MKNTQKVMIPRFSSPKLKGLLGFIILVGGLNQMNAQSPAEKVISLDRPIVVGHRGYPTIVPENTLQGFELAKLAGADLVELDYHMDRDGKAIVIHDSTLDRTTDVVQAWGTEGVSVIDKSIAEMTALDAGSWYGAAFAGTHLPTLEEAIEVIQKDGGMTLIERKAGSPEHIVKLLREKNLINQLIVQSFDWEYVKAVRELAPNQVLGAIGPQKTWNNRKVDRPDRALSPKWIDRAMATGANFMVWNRDVNPEAMAYAHEKGFKVIIYTINDVETAQELLRMGADGIITNNTAIVWKAIALLNQE